MRQADAPIPRWLVPSCLALSLLGVGVSAYLTVAHYTSSNVLACSANGLVNCERVTTSAQSMFLGIPVAVLGLAWFVAMAAITAGPAWRSRAALLWWGRIAMAVAGVGFALYLVYAELFTIGAICLWCTVAHVLAFGLFVVVAFSSSALRTDPVR